MTFNHQQEHIDEEMILIQANIDDMNPEWTTYVTEQLFEAGANDVYWIPIIMKKGRPGIMLNVLVHDRKLDQMEEVIFRETTTLGIRYLRATCHRLGRDFIDITTRWGIVQVKVGYHQDQIVQFAPEFSQCERIAREHQVPLKQVYDEVRRLFANRT